MTRGVSILPCFVLALLVLAVVLVVVMLLRRRGRGIQHPACGKCGYAVQGLPTFTCPECGSDLRVVGIITPGRTDVSPRTHGVILVLLWTLALPIPAMILSAVVLQLTPQATQTRSQRSMGDPHSGAYKQINLEQRLIEKGNHVTSNRVTYMLVSSQGRCIQIEIDPIVMGYRYQTQSGEEIKADGGLKESTFLDWMAQAGIDREDEWVTLEAAELMTLAQGAALGTVDSLPAQHFRLLGTSRSSHAGPARWVPAVATAFWLVLWLLGCWKFWKIGTRKPA